MSKLGVSCFSLSLEGYGAGPRQDRDNPLGVGGEKLHEWRFPTRSFKSVQGKEGGTTGVDDDYSRRFMDNVGAFIMIDPIAMINCSYPCGSPLCGAPC